MPFLSCSQLIQGYVLLKLKFKLPEVRDLMITNTIVLVV